MGIVLGLLYSLAPISMYYFCTIVFYYCQLTTSTDIEDINELAQESRIEAILNWETLILFATLEGLGFIISYQYSISDISWLTDTLIQRSICTTLFMIGSLCMQRKFDSTLFERLDVIDKMKEGKTNE